MIDKQFILKNKSLLARNDFDGFFAKLSKSDLKEYAEFFYAVCGVNIFKFMSEIPDDMLNGSTQIKSVDLTNVVSIGKSAFADSSVSQVIMGDGIKDIGDLAFAGCENLDSVRISENPRLYKLPKGLFENCKSLTKIYIPMNITEFSNGTFKGCDNIKIVADWREKPMDKISFPSSDMQFYKDHFRFKKQKQQEVEEQ